MPCRLADANGALVIDETGDRKEGAKTAHVGRQYLGSIGKIANGGVSVGALGADERVYYPVDVEPYWTWPYESPGICAFGFGKEMPRPAVLRDDASVAVKGKLPRRRLQGTEILPSMTALPTVW